MDPLILQGVQLMAVGMGTVFSFLTILIFATVLMSRSIARFAPAPLPEKGGASDQSLDTRHVAAITAAISKFEKDHSNK